MLDNGDSFPALAARDLEGEAVTLNEFIEGSWSVVLFYRGHW